VAFIQGGLRVFKRSIHFLKMWPVLVVAMQVTCSAERQSPQANFNMRPEFKLSLLSTQGPQKILSFYAQVVDKNNIIHWVDLDKDPAEPLYLARGKVSARALAVLSNEDSGTCPDSLSFYSSEGSFEANLRKEKEEKSMDLPVPLLHSTLQVRLKILRNGTAQPAHSVSLANPLSQTALSSRCLSLQGSSATSQNGELNIETPIVGTWPLSWTVFDVTIKQNVYFSFSPPNEVINAAKSSKNPEKPELSLAFDLATKKLVRN
jgi:hypothetical protein